MNVVARELVDYPIRDYHVPPTSQSRLYEIMAESPVSDASVNGDQVITI